MQTPEEGLYNLYFHNCFNLNASQPTERSLNINLTVSEDDQTADHLPISALGYLNRKKPGQLSLCR